MNLLSLVKEEEGWILPNSQSRRNLKHNLSFSRKQKNKESFKHGVNRKMILGLNYSKTGLISFTYLFRNWKEGYI